VAWAGGTKEVGIGLAVGATFREVLTMIIREGMSVILGGAAIGVRFASASARVVRHLLYGSATAERRISQAAVLVVISAGVLACSVPARRAA
jgi:ABC-type antimicrobial peptide transport system permease subunit